jgi:hypothetical protein
MYSSDDPNIELQQGKCTICGGQDFEWGRLQVYYIPGSSMWSTRGRQVVKARRCLRCNNLLQFTDQSMTGQQNRTIILIVVIALLFSFGVAALSLFFAFSSAPR